MVSGLEKGPLSDSGVRFARRATFLISCPHLHIGKAGGTSFAAMMSKELGKVDFDGGKHFDWTYVDFR